MIDLLAGKRAKMACRIYLKLFDAGPDGANITKGDAIGPHDSEVTDWPVAVEVIRPFVDDTILDEAEHRDGVPRYRLTRPMRDRMNAPWADAKSLVESLRSDLGAYDRGERMPDDTFLRYEAMIRTGHETGEPL